MRRPRLLDLYCKAGGTSMGYHMAGFEIVGVDKEPQPNYPFRFFQMDITDITKPQARRIRKSFDAVAASPPCQAYSTTSALWPEIDHPDLVDFTRNLLTFIGLPYIIENVPGAPLFSPVMLCGSSFGLRVRRHRLFETSFSVRRLPCNHRWQSDLPCYDIRISTKRALEEGREEKSRPSGVMPVHGFSQLQGGGDMFEASVAMGINWMTKPELNQAIPPAYTYYIGRQLMRKILTNGHS